jgi:hypothetical protein
MQAFDGVFADSFGQVFSEFLVKNRKKKLINTEKPFCKIYSNGFLEELQVYAG